MFLYSNFNIKQDKQITFLNVIELISKLDSPNSGHQIWQKWKLKILTDF